mgnify:CR=1 FL=1
MVLLENRYGYVFDPETMYQPAVPEIEHFDHGHSRFYPDGRVETLDADWVLDSSKYKGWNNYSQGGGGFRAYVTSARQFWPHRPSGFTAVDHINRDRGDDSWANLRVCSTSLNNLNQALARLGTASKSLSVHSDFVTKLSDVTEKGIGNLVDADLAKESAKLQALQTKQQLGVQALSIANQASGIALSFFR